MPIPFVRQFDDLAQGMANPNPDRPISNAIYTFGRRVCDGISANPGLYAPTILQSPLRAACTPYWDSQGFSEPEEVVPFTGGQCANVYRINGVVNYEIFIGNTQQTTQATENVISEYQYNGPITGITFRYDTPGPWGDRRWIMDLQTANGTIAGVRTVLNPVSTNRVQNASFAGGFDILPGQVDNCGDPPPNFEPGPVPAPDPGPLPPGTGPQIDARGNVILVLPGAVQITPTFELELAPGEINLGSGTGGGDAEEPLPGEELLGENSGAGGGDNDFGDPPEGERWVGCCVNIIGTPAGSGRIPQAEPESIYPTTIGNVRLRFKSEAGAVEYDTPLVNRQKTTCVWEPVRGLEPTGVRVNLLPGYGYTFRPYSVPTEQ